MVFVRIQTVAFAVRKIIAVEEELLICNVACDGVLAFVRLLHALIFPLSSFAKQILTCLFLHFTHE